MGGSESNDKDAVTNRLHISDQNLYSLYNQVLELSGLPKEKLKTIRVKVGEFKNERIDMFTLIIDPDGLKPEVGKPIMVFLHGYAASAVLYYHIYKQLSDKFTVIAVDQVGMGASSRPNNFNHENITYTGCLNYFVEYIEVWRQRFSQLVLGRELTDFYLMGHSFGGFTVSHYANKYPQHVKQLILMSPIGCSGYDTLPFSDGDALTQYTENRAPCVKDFPLTVQWGLNIVWKQRISPYDVGRVMGDRFLKMFIDDYLEDRILDQNQRDIVAAFTFQIFMKKSHQEMVLLVLFDKNIQAYLPFEKAFYKNQNQQEMPFSLNVIMGDDDWVLKCDNGASPRLVNQLNKREGDHSSYHVLPGSGHILNVDNPKGLVNLIFNLCFGGNRPVMHPKNYISS